MIQIYIRKLRIPFEWLEFAFEHFESLSNGSNLHSNASNPFEYFKFSFECFEWLEFAFECFNPFRRVKICNWMLRIPFRGLEFAFECFKSLSKG